MANLMSSPRFWSIHDLHQAFEKKSLSPVELTQECLKEAKKSQLGAFITLCEEKALKQAQAAQARLSKDERVPREEMPLFGIPIGIKDLLTTDGVRTTCASKMLENYIPPYTATAVQRLEAAGAVIVGKTNLDEFGMGSSNENSAFGPVSHPTHPGWVAGGSSGGSAAAVRAGLCTLALGTDTGGSIRLPASYCGVVGIKPTYGRISRYGLVAYASSLDQIGPFAQRVEDAAIAIDVMSGRDPLDSTSSSRPKTHCASSVFNFANSMASTASDWSKIRIGIPKEYFVGGLAPDVEKAIQGAIDWFTKKGAKIVSVSLPHTKYAVSVYYVVAVSEASSNLARFDGVRFGARPMEAEQVSDLTAYYKSTRSLFGAEVKRRIILGTFALSSGYQDAFYKRARQVRRKVKEDFDQAFQKVDLIISPVSPSTAFKMGEKKNDPLKMYLNDVYTIPANLSGLPAMSLPCGKDHEGLPIGMHLIAAPFQEEFLLSVARAFQVEMT